MKVHTDIPGVEYWYDPHVRCWYCATVDAQGNLGEAQDAYSRREIRVQARQLAGLGSSQGSLMISEVPG